MPADQDVSASLAYRKNEAAIFRGEVPEKYTRLLPFIVSDRVVEFGSAEGVLALLLAKAGKRVTAVERRAERIESAVKLREAWGSPEIEIVNASIADRLDLFEGKDTIVAVRVIYYLGEDLDRVFGAAAEAGIQDIVLCGNKNRAHWWREGLPNRNDRADNYYASAEGMKDVLTRHGYAIAHEVLDGDPIIVGQR